MADVRFFAGRAGPVTLRVVYRDNNLKITGAEIDNAGKRNAHITLLEEGLPPFELIAPAEELTVQNAVDSHRMVENEEGDGLTTPPQYSYAIRWGAV